MAPTPDHDQEMEMGRLQEEGRPMRHRIRDRLVGIVEKAVREAVADDAEYQKGKPQRLKDIDKELDDHLWRKLFT